MTSTFLRPLDEKGIQSPTPIQSKAIPPISAGQDLIGIAPTGTGKTLAYLLPALKKINYAQGQDARALILAPTRELVLQIGENIRWLTANTDIRSVILFGGKGMTAQLDAVKNGVDIISATPGRLIDAYFSGRLSLKKIQMVVLDEADRMLDMGFYPQLKQIQEVIPRKRQNLLFSATFPPKVEKLTEDFLLYPTKVEVAPQATPVETVEQQLYKLPNYRTKLNLLAWLIENSDWEKVIIFVRTKSRANAVGKVVQRKTNGEVRVMHANKNQNSRLNALKGFREGEVQILVSTDVTARGIDIEAVNCVINFDIPLLYEDYVHRIGRTGRAFRTGLAISFVNPAEEYHIAKIEELIAMKIDELTPPEELETIKTEKAEIIEQAREIDKQRRKEDPNFKGAFHRKKKKKRK